MPDSTTAYLVTVWPAERHDDAVAPGEGVDRVFLDRDEALAWARAEVAERNPPRDRAVHEWVASVWSGWVDDRGQPGWDDPARFRRDEEGWRAFVDTWGGVGVADQPGGPIRFLP